MLPCEEIDFKPAKVLADHPSASEFIGFYYKVDGFGDLAMPHDLGKFKTWKTGSEHPMAYDGYEIGLGKTVYDFSLSADHYRFMNRARTVDAVLASDNRSIDVGKSISDSVWNSDKVRVARVLLGKEPTSPTDFLSMTLMRRILDGVNTADNAPVLGVGLNPSDAISVSDGAVSSTVPPTVSYDDDYDPYFVRIYDGKTNLSYSELGRTITIDIMESKQ